LNQIRPVPPDGVRVQENDGRRDERAEGSVEPEQRRDGHARRIAAAPVRFLDACWEKGVI
jgi:hypothetical protein